MHMHALLSSFSVLHFSLLQRLDGKSKDISKIAADITQNVSLRQGMERKKVMQHIRGLYKTDLSASRHWQELVQQLTHDRSASLTRNNKNSSCHHLLVLMLFQTCTMLFFSPIEQGSVVRSVILPHFLAARSHRGTQPRAETPPALLPDHP